ncbi:MAG: hypothetical protein IKO56_05200 [Alphaproteobacteria bacterium]|nr:hypothetical protein [Alphaproteobacteria bacterium]
MKKLTFLAASAALMLAACSEPLQEAVEIEPTQSTNNTQLSAIDDTEDTPIVLGEKLNNPYTVDNMRKAIEVMNSKRLTKSAISTDIKPTHYYIKFKPKNEADLDKLDADTAVFYYSFPLDYEILQEGTYYHDPELPNDVPTYQYCAAEVDHKLPDVEYEILAELYILEDVNVVENGKEKEEDKKSLLKSKEAESYWETLEMEAKLLVGYKVDLEKHSKWTPEGYLYYQDNDKGKCPLEGVPVHLRKNIFVGHQCCTNANGYFSFSKIREKASYLIRWKRDNFKIKNDNTGSADVMLKKNTRDKIDRTFNIGENQWRHASLFRAAHYYYYGDIHSLKRPPEGMRLGSSNSAAISQPPYEKYDWQGSFDAAVMGSENGTEIGINIYGMTSKEIFNTTVRQLAKSVHCSITGKGNYNTAEAQLRYTWANYCGSYLTDCFYKGKDVNNGSTRIKKMENALYKTWYYQEWLNIVNI